MSRMVLIKAYPKAGDRIEFASDRLTDKGPSSGSILETKITVDGLYVKVRHSDAEETMSWDDLIEHAQRTKADDGKTLWMIKAHVHAHQRHLSSGKVVAVREHEDKRQQTAPRQKEFDWAAVERAPATDTPAFKRWFGDSKVVDEQGKPLVVYHGTNSDFEEFNVGPESGSDYPSATAWFSRDSGLANGFVRGGRRTLNRDGKKVPKGAAVYPVFLSIQKPVDVSGMRLDQLVNIEEFMGQVGLGHLADKAREAFVDSQLHKVSFFPETPMDERRQRVLSRPYPVWKLMDDEGLVSVLREAGHDGFVASEDYRMKPEGARRYATVNTKTYAVFSPGQVKSATGNSGEFDPENPSMVKSVPIPVLTRDHEPTDAQKEAGNYKVKRRDFAGMSVSIENPAGSYRRGQDRTGKTWETRMLCDYGYIRGTLGVDGDHVDCYLGPNEDAPMVYVIHQRRYGDWDKFDEDKCMLGFDSQEDAVAAYLKHYDDPRFLGPVTPMTVGEFKEKVMSTRDNPRMIKGMPLILKANVRQHTRKLKSGKVITVRGYTDKRTKKTRSSEKQADMFSAADEHGELPPGRVVIQRKGAKKSPDKAYDKFLSDVSEANDYAALIAKYGMARGSRQPGGSMHISFNWFKPFDGRRIELSKHGKKFKVEWMDAGDSPRAGAKFKVAKTAAEADEIISDLSRPDSGSSGSGSGAGTLKILEGGPDREYGGFELDGKEYVSAEAERLVDQASEFAQGQGIPVVEALRKLLAHRKDAGLEGDAADPKDHRMSKSLRITSIRAKV